MSDNTKKEENQLNKNAKEYIPTKNRLPKKLDFNLNAKEYKPKEKGEVNDNEEEGEVQEKMDMIVKDMAEDAVMEELGNEGSDDEDVWLQKYKDCQCCQGFVYKCKGETCSSLGQCYCKMKDDCEGE